MGSGVIVRWCFEATANLSTCASTPQSWLHRHHNHTRNRFTQPRKGLVTQAPIRTGPTKCQTSEQSSLDCSDEDNTKTATRDSCSWLPVSWACLAGLGEQGSNCL